MLKAYEEATPDQRARIRRTYTGPPEPPENWVNWGVIPFINPQIVDETRPDLDAYIAKASPVLGNGLKRMGISYAHIGTRSIYALNALNKVTDDMLPGEMPPVPQNSREPRRRGAPGLSPAPVRRPAGRS